MFTGIIEETGTVEEFTRQAHGATLKVGAETVLSDLTVGGSIAVNGVCLTATAIQDHSFSADLSPETLERTNLSELKSGSKVNLERPLLPTGRLSGHFVQGHVDGVGELVSLAEVGDGNWWLRIRVPPELLRYLVYKGSIAIEGISLTIASVEKDTIGVAIIPHTYEATSLGKLGSGAKLNLECDVIAKHVERLMASIELEPRGRLTVDDLKEQGF